MKIETIDRQKVPAATANVSFDLPNQDGSSNQAIARRLEEIAELLEAQNANPYRVLAYRLAADTVRSLPQPAQNILNEHGDEGLIALPGIGQSIAQVIRIYLQNERIPLLEQLRRSSRPERVLSTVPTIGPTLAKRIHEELGIETLSELEDAAYDGRLSQVPGFGQERLRAVRESLAGRLHRPQRREHQNHTNLVHDRAPIADLLDIDREYRRKAKDDRLQRVAPRRFNPTGEAWLPVLNTERNGTRYTALFSNTAHAHEAMAIRDWVVIYQTEQNGRAIQGQQWTVITSKFGSLRDKRIVRGREKECQLFYATSVN